MNGSPLPKRYTITAALPYANGFKHIGHLAGVYLPADIYVRYLRAQKRDVIFVSGSDENGAAITLEAIKQQKSPQEIVDYFHPIIKNNLTTLGISFDIYSRTSDAIHHQTAKEFFDNLLEKRLLVKEETKQFFDSKANIFLADRYIKGICPICRHPEAYGDQCEKCGSSLSPSQLKEPKSVLSNAKLILKKTSHYYIPLQNYENFMKEWIKENESKGWKQNVIGQVNSWIRAGLQTRAVTRDLDWGVKVNVGDTEKVLYVWFDAPIGYISATKQWAAQYGKDWQPYWKDTNTKLVHFIGKDNIVFHCIIFPIMLHLEGYVLPDQVPANEFMNLEGDKMSTSKNWKLDINDYINDFILSQNGSPIMADALRYYLTQIMPETKDSEFLWKKFQEANNNELVGIWGNYINRVWILSHKLCGGRIPQLHQEILNNRDQEFIDIIKSKPQHISQLLEQYLFREALSSTMDLARTANKYLQDKEPWIIQKTLTENPEQQKVIDNTLHLCLQAAANMAILINPFLPFTASKMCKMMKVVDKMLEWKNAGSLELLQNGYPLPHQELLFRPIEDDEMTLQINKLNDNKNRDTTNINKTQKISKQLFLKPQISFDTFSQLDLRVGTILAAEKIQKTDKLMLLRVDIGIEQRNIVSGIAHLYAPEELVNIRVVVVANLEPRQLMGVESKGMILMNENADGNLYFVSPENASENGQIIS